MHKMTGKNVAATLCLSSSKESTRQAGQNQATEYLSLVLKILLPVTVVSFKVDGLYRQSVVAKEATLIRCSQGVLIVNSHREVQRHQQSFLQRLVGNGSNSVAFFHCGLVDHALLVVVVIVITVIF
jgi:hypothetical protein